MITWVIKVAGFKNRKAGLGETIEEEASLLMEVKVYADLRTIVGGKSVQFDSVQMTVGQMLETLFSRFPALQEKLLTRSGEMHSAFHILINGRDARYLEGLETVITAEDEVRIFPPVGGGRG